jgi:hypothetical protein
MSEEKVFRPDLGLRIAIYGHLLEYKGQLKNLGNMTDDGIVNLSVIAKSIADSWVKELAEFDDKYGELNSALSDATNYSNELEEHIKQLAEQLADAQPTEAPNNSDLVEAVVVDEDTDNEESEATGGSDVEEST